ncbi:MAG TPA: phosphoenolpyruvate synthase regulatory protein, partial [Alphaproteobacteria bacterium]|nr:phosphoenolpyruvate synthase regulatory protein [Alphaproteobacteria bacterium]
KAIETHGGVVFFSIAERELRSKLEDLCRMHNIPALSVLDHVIHTLSKVLGQPDEEIRGGQHRMDEAYFDRIEALDFTIQHDDGQGLSTVGNADILIVGVSRSSKTPTSIYLAHRGYKVANYPLVPGVPMPLDEMPMGGLFTVGLIKDARRLVQIRRNRLLAMNERENSSYADMKTISDEINNARKLFTSQNWPVIDVSRRSVEETAAEIINLYNTWLENEGAS